jgi:hypothetical protein
MPGACGSGLLGRFLVAHHHHDLGAERALVELDRFFAAAVEEQVGLDVHDGSWFARGGLALYAGAGRRRVAHHALGYRAGHCSTWQP